LQTADDLFGGPQGSPRTDKLIAASVQWAEGFVFEDLKKRRFPAEVNGRPYRRPGTIHFAPCPALEQKEQNGN
jgi:hypothetical protein